MRVGLMPRSIDPAIASLHFSRQNLFLSRRWQQKRPAPRPGRDAGAFRYRYGYFDSDRSRALDGLTAVAPIASVQVAVPLL